MESNENEPIEPQMIQEKDPRIEQLETVLKELDTNNKKASKRFYEENDKKKKKKIAKFITKYVSQYNKCVKEFVEIKNVDGTSQYQLDPKILLTLIEVNKKYEY